jgi:hypothetical protein
VTLVETEVGSMVHIALSAPLQTNAGERWELRLRAPWREDYEAVRASPIRLGCLVWLSRLSGYAIGELLGLTACDLETCARAVEVLLDLHRDAPQSVAAAA